MEASKSFFDKLTIKHILVVGLVLRLLAVFFSPGYAFYDDHFELPELVYNWKNGISFLWTGSDVHVFSLVYPGILYLLFEACHGVGINAPEDLMFVTRLFHALFSLVSIYYAYLLTLRLTENKDTAKWVALAMAIFWIFPFMSVRTLREFFCIPFLLMGCYHIADPKFRYRSLCLAALFFAFSFSIRLQVVFIPLGIGLCLLFNKKYFKQAIVFGIAFIIAYFLTQGLFDLVYYGDPFANIKEYARYNSNPANISSMPQGPWYQYIGTVAVILFGFPFLVLLFGYINSARLSLQVRMLFWGSLLFFAFHSYYSNKQERFILPFVPFFIMLGIIGWRDYFSSHTIQPWLKKTTNLILFWFFVLNMAGLLLLTFTYTKRSRVESMIYLRKKGDVSNIIIEGEGTLQRPPTFYLGKHLDYYELPGTGEKAVSQLTNEIKNSGKPAPNYVIMQGNQHFDQRLFRLQTLFNLTMDTVITTSFVDNLAYRLNPKHNRNENWYIYRIGRE